MNKFEFKNLTPFKWFVLENFPFIEADFDALTEWQLFCKLGKEMNKIINSENTLGTQMENVTNAFIDLQNYVNNYFDNLDVQEEINNKLNEMAESGTLQEIIESYLNSRAIFGFDNVASMKEATNLINGSYAQTYGFYNKNDGGSALYKIRNITNDDVVDNMFILPMQNQNLVAELIIDDLYIEQIGAKGNGINNDTTILQTAINYCINKKITLKSRGGKTFLISSSLNLNNKIDIDFNNSTITTNSAIDMLVFNYATGNEYQGFLKNIVIDMNSVANIGIHGVRIVKKLISGITIKNITKTAYQMDGGNEVIFKDSHFYGTSNTSVGLRLNKGDCHYNDIIMIDVHTAIIASSTNFYSRIHAWIKTKELIPNSIFMRCTSTSQSFLNQCYSDTYHYGFYVENDHRIKLTEHYNYNNQNIMDSEILSQMDNMIYMFYFTNSEWSQRVSITNSHIMGLPGNNLKASFINIPLSENLMYCDEQTRIINFLKNFKANEIPITVLLDSNFSLSSSYKNQINRISNVIDLNLRLQANNFIKGSNQTTTVYKIPQEFTPITETSFLIPQTSNTYVLKGYLLCYITEDGDIKINIPTGTDINTNDRLLINKSFITVSSQP